MDEMMGGYPDPPIQAAIHPRAVKGEAAQIAESNKGGGMRNLLENYGNLHIDDHQAGHKVLGAEANEYAERNHGKVCVVLVALGVEEQDPLLCSWGGCLEIPLLSWEGCG